MFKFKAFTLVELLVVIAIVGLLSTIVLAVTSGLREQANLTKVLVWARSVQSTLGANAVGVWDFNEMSMDTCSGGQDTCDVSGWNNHGTVYGDVVYTTSTPSSQGRALSFDGNGDYVDCGNNTSLDFDTNDFTVEVWAKAIGGITGRGIINKGGWGSTGYTIQQFYSPANRYAFGVKDINGNKYVVLPLLETWDWTHIIGVKKSNSLEAWVNGVKVGNVYSGAIGSLSSPTKKFEIGRSSDPYYFNGFIDQVRVYNIALNAFQIQSQYYVGLNRLLTKGLIGEQEYRQYLSKI
jgi:prepilin-type N-terminal cleavage/methylation domain-containing protein